MYIPSFDTITFCLDSVDNVITILWWDYQQIYHKTSSENCLYSLVFQFFFKIPFATSKARFKAYMYKFLWVESISLYKIFSKITIFSKNLILLFLEEHLLSKPISIFDFFQKSSKINTKVIFGVTRTNLLVSGWKNNFWILSSHPEIGDFWKLWIFLKAF